MLIIKVLRTPEEKQALQVEGLADNFQFFSPNVTFHRSYLAAFYEEQIVGLIAFVENDVRVHGAFGVAFISTHREQSGKGIDLLMIDAFFSLASSEGKMISYTPRETPDKERLAQILAQQSQVHAVNLYEWDDFCI